MHFWRRSLASATGLPWLCLRKPEQVLACVVRQRNVERSPGPEKITSVGQALEQRWCERLTYEFYVSSLAEPALDERAKLWMFLPREQSRTGRETEL